MKFFLPKLEYEYSALEPWLDAKTMEIHYSKHHKTYCDKLNLALENHPEFFKEDVNEILAGLNQLPEEIRTAVRNNGGGFANHNLYWEIMTEDVKKRELKGDIKKAIEEKFGSFEEFKQNFNAAALMHFGSGWVWLVLDNGELKIVSTSNQDNPITDGKIPLLCIDLWEHAYYLHYQNRRADFIEAWWNVVNWEKVNEKYLNAA